MVPYKKGQKMQCFLPFLYFELSFTYFILRIGEIIKYIFVESTVSFVYNIVIASET